MFARLTKLWERYLNSGNRHFKTPTELKHNKVLNLLFSLNFLANFYLIFAELIIFAFLLHRDSERYWPYFIPFAIVNALFPLLIGMIIWLKNRYGLLQMTYLSDLIYTAYCVILSIWLGAGIGIQLILLAVVPIVFIIYDYGHWKEVFIHTGIMTSGILIALVSYHTMQPIFPLPEDITRVAGFLCWFAAISILLIYSIFNWKEVHKTETLLTREKYQTEALLKETIPQLEIAEAKYRHLIDDSSDLVFQMNQEGIILSMNRTCTKMLGFIPEEMVGQPLYSFVTDTHERENNLNSNIVREHIRDFLENKTLSRFRTTLRKKHMYEPIEVEISLQKNLLHWRLEIIGKVSLLHEDIAQRFLEKEKGSYTIGNNIAHAEILSQKLSERIMRYFNTSTVNTVRICIREILINAIEHGNLEISFHEKTDAIENNDYMEFLLARQKDLKYAGRSVKIDYLINKKILMFRITDDGPGFDHKKFFAQTTTSNTSMLEHGRGLIMTRNAFDTVVFNDKGNQVILTKHITHV